MAKWIMDLEGDLVNLEQMSSVFIVNKGPDGFEVKCVGHDWESTLTHCEFGPDSAAYVRNLLEKLEK